MGLIELVGERRVYLDANTFIYAVENAEPYAAVLQPLLADVEAGRLFAVTSELTLAEALVFPIRERDRRRQAVFARSIRNRGGLTVAPVSREVLVEAARFRASMPGLKLPDAIHVATARLHDCAVFVTNDSRLQDLPGLDVIQLGGLVKE